MNLLPDIRIPHYLDYTLLKQEATWPDVQRLCEEAIAHQVQAVCVSPYMAPRAAKHLGDSQVKLCSVVGFPHGQHFTETKLQEAQQLMQIGCDELDVVWNLTAFKSGDYNYIRQELAELQRICRQQGVLLKVILETGALSEKEIKSAVSLVTHVGLDFVKTSTGFYPKGAELEKVQLLRSLLPPAVQIKASGGIRTREDALAFIAAGASRIGASTLLS